MSTFAKAIAVFVLAFGPSGAAAQSFFRSAATGDWNVAATWESAPAPGGPWSAAAAPPTSTDYAIQVLSPHTVTITASTAVDEVHVAAGATLIFSGAVSVTIDDGPGPDLSIDGTLEENSTGAIAWQVGATWVMGAAGTLVKTTGTSSNNWRNNYWSGIANIPATSRWILRKTGGASPPISSVGGSTYPNLILENYSGGVWLTNIGSSFTGSADYPVIKGDLDIGGTGPDGVSFLNQNTHANATLVQGDLLVRAGSTYRNYGTGTEILGDMVIDGTLEYDGSDARRIVFSGTGPQTVSGAGTAGVFNLVMNKPAGDLTLNRPLQVDNNITFNAPGGRIFTSVSDPIVVSDDATVNGMSNTGFVHGPLTKIGDEAFLFPVGKNFNLQPVAIGAAPPPASAPFWAENFGAGCNSGFQATAYTGPNGTWSVTSTGTNEAYANVWYVSAAENGQGAGACGAGCGSDRTLHVGSHPSIAADPGAAYFESDAFTCSFLGWCSVTDKRVESPVIDCSGKTGITLTFDYIEWGEGANDNATLWYYDGSAWSQLTDLAKTPCCGGVACNGLVQGLWNAYSTALPASADNNPSVRIGFRWVNNGNGIATDPSFAVDNIVLTTSATPADAFTAEYHYTDPAVPYGNVLGPSLDHISRCEYWMLTRDAGTSGRTVTLTWDFNSCGVTYLPDLRVARWQATGSVWNDLGNGGTTGSTAAGTVVTAGAVSLFGPFTLSSATAANPLPVTLVEFDARPAGTGVDVRWVTASEVNSDYFTVERAGAEPRFEEIARVEAAGYSTRPITYRVTDAAPLHGLSWYRLRQTDYDGSTSTSDAVPVHFHAGFTVYLVPDRSGGKITLHADAPLPAPAEVMVTDCLGAVLCRRRIMPDGFSLTMHLPALAQGVYLLRIAGSGSPGVFRFVY